MLEATDELTLGAELAGALEATILLDDITASLLIAALELLSFCVPPLHAASAKALAVTALTCMTLSSFEV